MWNSFINRAKDYFTFSKSQQGGIIFLSAILILIIAFNYALPYLVKNESVSDGSFLREIEAFRASVVVEEEPEITDPFPFDPNLISYEKMIELGLSEYQAGMIVKYRNAGGKFFKKEDFKRIYSIGDEDYNLLEPFINIPEPRKKPKAAEFKPEIIPMPFNPNTVDTGKLKKIGLSENQVSQIINYRNAGGIFRIKSDFKKIYSISEDEYDQLEKYILLPSKIDSAKVAEIPDKGKKSDQEVRPVVEINSADTSELTELYGIGPYYAKKIVAYREKLGGFYDKAQLLEVFGIDSTRYFGFTEQVEVDNEIITRIDLNNADFREMLKHPYFEYYMVKEIFNYKDAVGDFRSVSELKQIDLVYDQLYNKLEPYLTVENVASEK